MTVGTQAAVLAGLDITMFIEFNPPHNAEWVGDPVALVASRRVMSMVAIQIPNAPVSLFFLVFSPVFSRLANDNLVREMT